MVNFYGLQVNIAFIFLLLHNSITFFFITAKQTVQDGLIPVSETQMTAMVWLRNYFVSFGDHQPNGELIRVSAPTKREVWVEYKRAQERKNCAFVKCKRFSKLWPQLSKFQVSQLLISSFQLLFLQV